MDTEGLSSDLMLLEEKPNITTVFNSTQAVLLTPFEVGLRITIGLGLCLASAIMPGLIAVSIFKGTYTESRFYIFMFFLSISRILYAMGHVVASIYHLLRVERVAPISMSSYACHVIQMLSNFPPTLELIFLLLLVIDRAVAFGFPLVYRNLGTRQAFQICIGACMFWFLIRVLPSYEGVSVSRTIQCVNTFAPLASRYAVSWQYLDMALSLGILVPYAYLLYAVRRRLRKDKDQNSSLQDASLKRLMKVVPFLNLRLVTHCALVISSRCMKLVAAYAGSKATEQRLVAYYGILAAVDIFVNAIIFFWKYPKIWNDSVRLLCGAIVKQKLTEWRIVRPLDMETALGPTTKIGAVSRIDLAPSAPVDNEGVDKSLDVV